MTKQAGTDDTQLFDGSGSAAVPAQSASTRQGHAGKTPVPLGASARHNPILPVGADLPPGYVVAEYIIDGVLGRGGMGCVYLANHPVIGKRVAIKVLSAPLSVNPELVRRFVDEARAVNKIGHRNIIDIFAFGQLVDGRQYFIMEYLEGETLAARLDRGAIPVHDLKWIVAQMCGALEAAHQEQIVHRDLKPENVWLAAPKHADPFLKILDFGIAKLIDESDGLNATQTGTVMGTPHFMSPEQSLGQRVDHRTDIYAMGVVLYRIATGRLPFDGTSYAEIVAKLLTQEAPPISEGELASEPLRALIMSCLEKEPNKRPSSARELGRLFEAFGDDMQTQEASVRGNSGSSLMAPPLPNVSTKMGFQENGDSVRGSLGHGPAARKLSAPLMITVGILVVGAVALALGWSKFSQNGTPYVQPAPIKAPPSVAPPSQSPQVAPEPVPPPAASEGTAPPTAVKHRPSKVVVPDAPAPSKPKSKELIRDNPF